MFNTPYYHSTIKKIIIGFGALFSNVQIQRRDSAGVLIQTIDVPLAYAPKEKWVTRVEQDPELENHVFTTIPRMSFEITGYNYDSVRAVNRNNKIEYKNGTNNGRIFSPVPYNIEISLYALTKGTEDGLALIEQILPIFTPEYTLNFTAIPEMGIKQEVPIVLNSVSVSDDYEGDFQTKRLVTHTLNFTAKANLYGPINTGGVITTTDVDIDTQVLNAGQINNTVVGQLPDKTIISDTWTGNV